MQSRHCFHLHLLPNDNSSLFSSPITPPEIYSAARNCFPDCLFLLMMNHLGAGLIISLLSAPTRATGGWIKNEKSTKSLTGSLERNYIHWAYTYFLHGESCLIHSLCVSSLKMLHAGRKNTYTRRSKRGDSTPGRKVSLGLQRNHSSSNSFMWIAKCKLDDADAYVRFDEQKTKLIVTYYKKFHFLNRHWGRNSFYFFH